MELIFTAKLHAIFILFNEDLVRNSKNANMKNNTAITVSWLQHKTSIIYMNERFLCLTMQLSELKVKNE